MLYKLIPLLRLIQNSWSVTGARFFSLDMVFLSVVWAFFDGFWGFNQYSGIFLGISGYFDMDSGFFVWFFLAVKQYYYSILLE